MESSATTSPVNSVWSSSLITFAAGASYGFVTVLVGQPLDTIKTRLQGIPESAHSNSFTVGRALFRREGVRGLYRGGLPLLLSGSLMRSAQFGVQLAYQNILGSMLPGNAARKQVVVWNDRLQCDIGRNGRRCRPGNGGDFCRLFKVCRQVENAYALKHGYHGPQFHWFCHFYGLH